jgi:hypothetical protein
VKAQKPVQRGVWPLAGLGLATVLLVVGFLPRLMYQPFVTMNWCGAGQPPRRHRVQFQNGRLKLLDNIRGVLRQSWGGAVF